MQKFIPLPHLQGWHFPTRQNLVASWGISPAPQLRTRSQLLSPRDIRDPGHWRSNAEEMRVVAEDMDDTETRRIINLLADGWDKMADRAERHAAKPNRGLDRNRD